VARSTPVEEYFATAMYENVDDSTIVPATNISLVYC
jgi:hypothetical protein